MHDHYSSMDFQPLQISPPNMRLCTPALLMTGRATSAAPEGDADSDADSEALGLALSLADSL